MNNLEHIFNLELKLNGNHSYLKSYPILLQQATRENLSFEDIVGLAHMVYGWMPTILTLHFERTSPEEVVQIVNAAKVRLLSTMELEVLKKFINNSLVGASKLLHFVAPDRYAIWDSKIYFYLHQKLPHQSTIGNIDKYLDYLSKLSELEKSEHFTAFHAKVNAKLGYAVSAKRALEVVMFEHSNPKS
ncbi:MAG: hypothetical protein ACRCV6_01840 [Formosimonas sp.]